MCISELTVLFAELTEFAPKLSEFPLPKQYALETVFRPYPTYKEQCVFKRITVRHGMRLVIPQLKPFQRLLPQP